MNIFELEHAAIGYDDQPVLRDMTWSLPDRGVLVVFGGGGTGKSSLLRALTGVRVPNLNRGGRWACRGDESAYASSRPLPDIMWCGQPPREFKPTPGRLWPGVTKALENPNAAAVLLDEPNAWIEDSLHGELCSKIRETAQRAAVVVTTHHVQFGADCADQVMLLGGNEILVNASSDAFFGPDAPEHARVFRRSGNVVPKRKLPPPAGLRWTLPDQLGGMGWPGTLRALDEELQSLADAGVTHLVTLTRTPLPAPRPGDFGIEGHHFPIPDMGVPTLRAAFRLASQLERWVGDGGRVVVHCRGGMGRTGLSLALALVQLGRSAEAAIQEVRGVNRHYIQTQGQAAFVRQFEEALRDAPSS